jgi:hypothetical protein
MVAERFETERLANRIMRRELVRTCLECFGSCFVGLVIMAVGFHVKDVELGKIWLYGGMIVGYVGILTALAGAYRRGEERGDW